MDEVESWMSTWPQYDSQPDGPKCATIDPYDGGAMLTTLRTRVCDCGSRDCVNEVGECATCAFQSRAT